MNPIWTMAIGWMTGAGYIVTHVSGGPSTLGAVCGFTMATFLGFIVGITRG